MADGPSRPRNPRPRSPRVTRVVLLLAPLLLLDFGPAGAQEWKEFRSSRQAAAYRSLQVEILYGAGRLHVEPAEGDRLYDVRMLFDSERYVPLRSWSEREGQGKLRVALTSAREEEDRSSEIRLDDFDLQLDVGDLKKLGDSSGRLDMRLSRDVPTELKVGVGAAKSAIELGGVPLTRLEFNTGASETRLSFEQPNPARLQTLSVKIGAASFRAEDLGNANFEHLTFQGGVGDITLEFGGEWRRDARASVKMGVGSLTLRFPRELGVRVRRKSFLTSFDAPELERLEEGVFESSNWAAAENHLELDLDAAFGSVRVEIVH
ncbi:MAG: hypothetical protein ACE5HP_01960 [Gemmatimonadota bacterium]